MSSAKVQPWGVWDACTWSGTGLKLGSAGRHNVHYRGPLALKGRYAGPLPLVSWRMIGYPGLPAAYADKALEYVFALPETR
jgi:hypothetical protein